MATVLPKLLLVLTWSLQSSALLAFQTHGLKIRFERAMSGIEKNLRRTVALTFLASGIAFQSSSIPVNAAGDQVFNEVWTVVQQNFVDNTFNGNNWDDVKRDYTEKIRQGANEGEITKKMLGLLGDKYTRLLDKAYFESIWKYDAIGVGLLFQSDPKMGNQMMIASPPLSGSSSFKAGFKKGDLIFAINGAPTDKMSAMQLLDMMSNDEQPTVTIDFSHADSSGKAQGERSTISLLRSTERAVNPVKFTSQKLKNGKSVGYVRLGEFNAQAVPGIREALVSLNKLDVDEILLDLRGNTGGGFQFALNIGGMFMDNKDMVTALGRGDEKSVFKTSYPEGVLYEKPLVLLTDGLSASASEVLAGGLHDNCRATITGSTTFGKGKIQAVFGLADGEGLTMTVAQYVTPRGTIIQSKGLQPDLPLPTLNPYLAMVAGPALTKVDLESIDFDRSESILKACSAYKN